MCSFKGESSVNWLIQHSSSKHLTEGCFPCLPCFHHNRRVFTHILASVPFFKALFVSFLVWIILKYEIHL
uniref:Uncharacterized protein n=1 Tax=Pelusios castaneus TaxID=367368 RepID=A0A8C8RA39_9SAUR